MGANRSYNIVLGVPDVVGPALFFAAPCFRAKAESVICGSVIRATGAGQGAKIELYGQRYRDAVKGSPAL